MKPSRIAPLPGQESVWDYPRPPRVEVCAKRIRVLLNGVVIADTHRAQRVLETSHPPVYYIPMQDIRTEHLKPTARRSFCEFKGDARYFSIVVGDRHAENAAWDYPEPSTGYEVLKGHVAFYPAPMDACYVDEERVTAQPGDYYGGWVTQDIVGPFKGEADTWGW